MVFTIRMVSIILRHYFRAHKVIVFTSYPMKNILDKPDESGQLSHIAIELSKFEIQYKPLLVIKGQDLVNFIIK